MPKLNHDHFRKMCRTVSSAEITAALGTTRQTVYNRMKNLKQLTVDEFLTICELIDEEPETFYSTGETQ